MIINYLITGDTHGDFSRFQSYTKAIQRDPYTAIVILGDAGFNFWLDKRDIRLKDSIKELYSFKIYCVRGNHEARPQDIDDMTLEYDSDVQGYVYYQPRWPQIRYFKDFGIYTLGEHSVGVIGGAYSVDKIHRLNRKIPWFANEQLSREEMETCGSLFSGVKLDFMFTHTCPRSWEPRDLFLSQVNQSDVDKGMENFLENIKDHIKYGVWCFGHYHSDRLERPHVEQFYRDTENLETLWNRWHGKRTIDNEWWLVKSPNYYMEEKYDY